MLKCYHIFALKATLICSHGSFVVLYPRNQRKELSTMQKTRILFVCHGNICRSPMAEFILKDMVKKARLDDKFIIRSAATSTEEIGNGLYPPAARCLDRHGIAHTIHCARQIKKPTTANMTSSSEWTRKTCGICSVFSPPTPTQSSEV